MRVRAIGPAVVVCALGAACDGEGGRDASVMLDEFDATSHPHPVTDAGASDVEPRDADNVADASEANTNLPGRDPDPSPLFGPDAGCGATYQQYDAVPGMHVPVGTPVNYTTNPPSSGDHYAVWAMYGVHREVLDPRYWVHDLEHGAVVVLYKCVGDCTALRTQLEDFVTHFPPEEHCASMPGSVPRRILITPDPMLETPVAAVSWGWVYRAQCFDVDSLTAFVRRRTGYSPEDNCGDGLL